MAVEPRSVVHGPRTDVPLTLTWSVPAVPTVPHSSTVDHVPTSACLRTRSVVVRAHDDDHAP